MTHTIKDYSNLPTEEAKDKVALNDLMIFLGDTRFNSLQELAKKAKSQRYLRDTIAFLLGVTGRPAEAFIREYASHLPEGEEDDFLVKVEEVRET